MIALFRGNKARKFFAPIDQNAIDVIERLQPYHSSDPQRNLLYVLNKLWNYDKHRDVVLTGSCVAGVRGTSAPGVIPTLTLGVIEDGAIILRVPQSDADGFDPKISFAVAFGSGSPQPIVGASVTSILSLSYDYVRDTVFPAFVELFP